MQAGQRFTAATLTLTGANSASSAFLGAANVSGGTLRLNGTLGDVTGKTARLTVGAGGTLQGIGNFAGDVTVAAGGTLAPGNSPGTLTIAGNLVQTAGSTTVFELTQPGVVGGGVNDLVAVGGNLTMAGTYQINAALSGYYRLFTYGGTLTNNGPTLSFAPFSSASLLTNVPGQVNLSLSNGGQAVQYWDGADATGATAGAGGGSGTWATGATNWTAAPTTGNVNNAWQGGVGVFTGAAGTVTVTGTQGFQGLQFVTSGYTLSGGALQMTGNAATGGNANASFLSVDVGSTTTIASGLSGSSAVIGLDKMGGGTLVLTGALAFTGATSVQAGRLALAGSASLASSSGVDVSANAVLDISGTTGTSVKRLTGAAGSGVALGSKTLTITQNGGTFAGVIADGGLSGGTGGGLTLALTAGQVETLTGANTYTGATTVTSGALALSGAGAIAGSTAVSLAAGTTLDLSQTTSGATLQGLTGAGALALGARTLTLSGVGGAFSGAIADGGIGGGTGGGLALALAAGQTEALSGALSFSGATSLQSGTLALSGGASLASSSGVDVAGGATLDVSGVSAAATSVKTLSGAAGSAVALGAKTLTVSPTARAAPSRGPCRARAG